MAVLLLHPQLATTVNLTAKNPATITAATMPDSPIEAATASGSNASHESSAAPEATVAVESAPEPEAETGAGLPDAPAPVLIAVASPAPMAFLKSAKPMTVSVCQLQAENRRKEMMWKGLMVASSGAAMFDAIVHATRDYDLWRGGVESAAEAVCRKFVVVRGHPGGAGAAGFCRQENDVQPPHLAAPHVVGAAKRQLRQFDFLRRAQFELSLNVAQASACGLSVCKDQTPHAGACATVTRTISSLQESMAGTPPPGHAFFI